MRVTMKVSAIACSLALASCYSPSAPSGSYQCDESGACPKGLTCLFGACVDGPASQVRSFKFDFSDGAHQCPAKEADLCVEENAAFEVKVTAFTDELARQPSTYGGAAFLDTSWGHARLDSTSPFTFKSGVATLKVTLDRATPPKSSAVLIARTGTTSSSSTQTLVIDPPQFTVDPQPIIAPANVGFAKALVGLPAVDHTSADGYRMYFSAVDSLKDAVGVIGLATSRDGNSWQVGTVPVLTPPAGENYLFPSLLRVGPSDLRLFFERSLKSGGMASDIYTSKFDGTSYSTPVKSLGSDRCDFCAGQIVTPWTISNPDAPDSWLLYFTTTVNNMGSFGVARSADEGATWSVTQMAAPGGEAGGALAPRVLYDPRTKVYRMWYTSTPDLLKCNTEIHYATSQDGVFFTAARSKPKRNPVTLADVPWAAASNPNENVLHVSGVYAGAAELADGGGYRVWMGPMVNALVTCLPVSIGRLTRP